jgi:putative flippase GtrA
MNRELGIFIVVGGLTVLLDLLTYRLLVWSESMDVNSAKGAGFLVGTLFAYFANRFWTFGKRKHAGGSWWRFIVLYTLTLSVNVAVNGLMLSFFFELPSWVVCVPVGQIPTQLRFLMLPSTATAVSFTMATGISAVLNYLGMKIFVFKNKQPARFV